MRKHFDELYQEFKTLPVEDISFPRGVSDIDKWVDYNGSYKKGTPIHVRASILYNQNTRDLKVDTIRNGDKIKFVYLKLPNTIREDCIGFPSAGKLPKELGLDKFIDYDKQFEKTFKSPLQSLTDVAKWRLEDFATLEAFFED